MSEALVPDAPTPNQQQPHSAQLDAQFYSLVKMSDRTLLSNKLQQLCASGFNVHSIYGGHTTAIYVASEYGNEELVQLLLEDYGAQEDILKRDRQDRDTAIHAATIGGNFAILRLLEGKVDKLSVDDIVNKYDHTPLHHALGKGRVSMATYWISRGADLGLPDWTGATPLHFAARNGEIEGLEQLKLHHQRRHHVPMNVNQQSKVGLTALHYAAWNGKDKALDWLLREGSDLEAVDRITKNTALHWAAMRGHRETVRILVRAHVRQGVEMFKENGDKKTVLELLEKYSPIEELHALLQLVEEEGLLDMKAFPPMVLVKYVMGHGNLKAIRRLERSLEYAAENCKSEDYKVNLRILLEDKLMMWLAKRGNSDSVSLLMTMETYLPGGFLPKTAASALNQALLNKRFEFADALGKHGKDRLPEWVRAMKVYLTINAGTLTDKLDKKDKAALMTSHVTSQDLKMEVAREIPLAFWVFQVGRNDVAKFFKDQKAWGSFINEQGFETQRTALHWAYKFDRKDIVKLLEETGCDRDKIDKYGRSPIRYAVKRRRERRQVFVDALNAIIVGAALIAAISFNGLVQPPLGYSADTGGPVPHVNLSSPWMKAFWFSNSLSFFVAMASALMALRGVLPMQDVHRDQVFYSIQRALLVASSLLVGSITLALIAFGSAGMAVLRAPVRVYMVIPTAVGGLLCILILFWFLWGMRLLRFPRKGKVQNGPSKASEVAEPEEVPVDNVKEPKYKPGPRYLEYPWEDGLDELYNIHQSPSHDTSEQPVHTPEIVIA